jgi:hypothetical protein
MCLVAVRVAEIAIFGSGVIECRVFFRENPAHCVDSSQAVEAWALWCEGAVASVQCAEQYKAYKLDANCGNLSSI